MPTDNRPIVAPTPETAAMLAVAMPLIAQFAAEISKLPPERQQERIAKVLTVLRSAD